MLSRRTFQFGLAGTAAALASGCALLPKQHEPAPPTLRFGDFSLISYGGGGIMRELRVFRDGAGVVLDGIGGVGGMLEPETMERLRTLIESPAFHQHLTRPLDESGATVCGGRLAAFKKTFRMGDLTIDVPCLSRDRPTLDEFAQLLAPYEDAWRQKYGERGFPAPLPDGQPALPKITVHELHNGDSSLGPRFDLQPDGSVTETAPQKWGPPDRRNHRISAPRLDALRLILRTELRPLANQSHEFALQVQVGDTTPVVVSQLGVLSSETESLDYRSIALIVASQL